MPIPVLCIQAERPAVLHSSVCRHRECQELPSAAQIEDEAMSEWKKDKADRGVFLRGKVWYIKFYDQTGKLRVERVGASKALARKVYQKRKNELHERRYFPSS